MVDGIDHLVVAVADLDKVATTLERRVGLVATGGGVHGGRGTANRIAWMADGSYLELITVTDPGEAQAWPVGQAATKALAAGRGFAAYALLDRQLADTAINVVAAGSALGPVQPGSRVRPDGEVVRWWSAFPADLGWPDGLPFLIRHAESGAEWSAAALADRARIPHPVGGPLRLVSLELAHADPIGRAAFHRDRLGLEFESIGGQAAASLGPHVLRFLPEAPDGPRVRITIAGAARPRRAEAFGIAWEITS